MSRDGSYAAPARADGFLERLRHDREATAFAGLAVSVCPLPIFVVSLGCLASPIWATTGMPSTHANGCVMPSERATTFAADQPDAAVPLAVTRSGSLAST